MSRFTGKTIIVTGAGSGIGRQTVHRFLAEGGNVVAVSRTEGRLREALAGLPDDRLHLVAGDAGDPAVAGRAVAAAVDRFGGLDVLVNNVGNALRGDVAAVDPEEWADLLRTNVTSAYLFARAALPELALRRGSIVQVSSVQGDRAEYGWVAYNTSKGAIESMTRSMALDHAAEGVRVNAVAPGLVDTPRTAGAGPEALAPIVARTPLGRAGTPAEIAGVIAFLAGDDASFVTGAVVPVDGGRAASLGSVRPADV
ncbi:dehydrogenase [Streptomyces sulfonofaciens]|uniref:Dehydrogenase n=1 Tax=Streptomyces sulfonofaciens TaxID=68272 RepID=A0A919GAP1_9ACTN|nr:SDR family NAD(P)-dependent oxidoreductase [Streptomyces sulfonofaciens]GHH81292.1 dehydrogenase [Streptomyces sulfonofaciens]